MANENPPLHPMVPFVTGWLAGVFTRDAGQVMNVDSVSCEPPDVVAVLLASGTVLRIHVSEVNEEKP